MFVNRQTARLHRSVRRYLIPMLIGISIGYLGGRLQKEDHSISDILSGLSHHHRLHQADLAGKCPGGGMTEQAAADANPPAGTIIGLDGESYRVHEDGLTSHIDSNRPQRDAEDNNAQVYGRAHKGDGAGTLSAYHPNGTKPVRAAIVSLVRNRDLFGMRQTIRQIEDRFNARFNYPYIFLNDVPFTEEFKRGVRDLTRANVFFGTLDRDAWGIPSWIDMDRFNYVRSTATYPHGREVSYRLMCRFQSGYMYRHPLLRDLEFYWRIEPDVEYYCDIDYDPFVFMKTNGLKYGWNIAMAEFMATIPSLWNATMSFVEHHPHHLSKENTKPWLLDDQGMYNGCHFWTNFEIVDLSFYRSKAYQDYFDFLDRSGGFFYERWGDAPIHSIAATLFLNASQIHYFSDIGYYHPSVMTCPEGSDMRGRCICDPSKSFIDKIYCLVRFKETKHHILYPNSTEPAHTGAVITPSLYVKNQIQYV